MALCPLTAEPAQRTDAETTRRLRRRAIANGTVDDHRDGSCRRELVSGTYRNRKNVFQFGLSAHSYSHWKSLTEPTFLARRSTLVEKWQVVLWAYRKHRRRTILHDILCDSGNWRSNQILRYIRSCEPAARGAAKYVL